MLYQYELAGCLTEEVYQASIPKECSVQSVQGHMDIIGGCWGLMASIRKGHRMNCGDCEVTEVNHQAQIIKINRFNAERAANATN
jgi:hypothetical protein